VDQGGGSDGRIEPLDPMAEAGRLWLQTARDAGLERSTLEYYQQHLERM
jgi:hypothetical protein